MKKLVLISFVSAILLSSCGKKTEETKLIVKDVTETVFASGALEAYETYSLTAQSDGYLIDVAFKENDLVKVGQVLAVIENKQKTLNTENANALYEISQKNSSPNSAVLTQAKNNIAIAKEKMDFDSLQAVRYKKLFESNSVAKADYENIVFQYQNSKGNYKNALENYKLQKQQTVEELVINKTQKNVNAVISGYNQIRALSAGKVYNKLKQKGDFVRTGDVIAIVGDANLMFAKVSVDESSISKVKVGQEAVIQLNTNSDKSYKGNVTEILPSFNEETQSFICKIYFSDNLDFKVANTQLQVNIITGINKHALLIPRNYLAYGNLVTVKGIKTPVKVKTKFVSNEWVQVLSGIDENTIIVTDNIRK